MKIESFAEALTLVYKDNPCGTQPNALWKTLKLCDDFNSEYIVEANEIKKLRLWNDNMLHTSWDKDGKDIDQDEINLGQFNMLLIHQSQLNDNITEMFPNQKSYFRLLHNNKDIMDIDIPREYYIREVNINTELQMVSDLICSSYDDIKPNVDEVTKWTKYPVFCNDLWIWIIEKKTDNPIALGIAELDANIKEGSLEWIQVLPEYRGKKLGKILVLELLKRLKPHGNFTTVSGEIDNKTNPERLYRSCGFVSDDIWYVMRK